MPLTDGLTRLNTDITRAQDTLHDIFEVLRKMSRQGLEDTPEYREMMITYQELARMITRATRQAKGAEEQQAQAARAAQALPARHDLRGIVPIKASLGPAALGMLARGPEVANLQRFLSAVGIPSPVTAEIDRRTQASLQQFQQQYRLKVTGTVGAETRKAINDILKGTPAG